MIELSVEYHDDVNRLMEEIEALSHWRDLALQLDNHRMQALWHLKRVLANENSMSDAQSFLSNPPLSASEIVAERDSLKDDAARYQFIRKADEDQSLAMHAIGTQNGLDDYIDAALNSSPENS